MTLKRPLKDPYRGERVPPPREIIFYIYEMAHESPWKTPNRGPGEQNMVSLSERPPLPEDAWPSC